jgi:predicted tellurium resistance membrane protein TerC
LAEDDDATKVKPQEHSYLRSAIITILIADLVMGLDNVIGVAAAAKGSMIFFGSRTCNQHSTDCL